MALYNNPSIFDGRVRLTAFGRIYKDPDVDEDWSFRYLTFDDGVDCSLTRHLPEIADELGIKEILAPSPVNFNAKMCYQTELKTEIRVRKKLLVRRGTNADGCLLRAQQTYAISIAGCALIIAQYPARPAPGDKVTVAVAHAGFDSVIDRQDALTRIPSREPQSIVESLLKAMGCSGKGLYRRKDVGVVIAFAISPTDFRYPWDHPTFGGDNERICEYLREKFGEGCVPGNDGRRKGPERKGKINLVEVITQQFMQLGVPLTTPQGECNITHIGEELFWKTVHPRGGKAWYTTRGEPRFRLHRNLLLVARLK